MYVQSEESLKLPQPNIRWTYDKQNVVDDVKTTIKEDLKQEPQR